MYLVFFELACLLLTFFKTTFFSRFSQILLILMDSAEQFVIVDKEGVEHTVEVPVLNMSDYLKGMKENGSIQENKIVLNTIQGSILSKVIEFCKFILLLVIL